MCQLAFSLLALFISGDVLLRELTGNGISWSHQAGLYANLVVAMFGMGIAAAAGTHLRPRFADHWLPNAWQNTVQRLSYLLTALFLFGFAVLGVQLVGETIELAEIASVLRIPLWPMQALIPLGFSATALRYGCYALHPQLAPVFHQCRVGRARVHPQHCGAPGHGVVHHDAAHIVDVIAVTVVGRRDGDNGFEFGRLACCDLEAVPQLAKQRTVVFKPARTGQLVAQG